MNLRATVVVGQKAVQDIWPIKTNSTNHLSLVAKTLDLQLAGCEFNSLPRRCRVTTLGKVVYTHVPQQVAVV